MRIAYREHFRIDRSGGVRVPPLGGGVAVNPMIPPDAMPLLTTQREVKKNVTRVLGKDYWNWLKSIE